MGKYRKYACDISGSLFKSVNRKGIRREKLAGELGISVNQLKNYAYDSGKSATLENFLCVLTKYKCVEVLDTIAKEMDCSVYPPPDKRVQSNGTDISAEALAETAKAVSAYLENERPKEEIVSAIRSSIEKLVLMEKSLELRQE